MMIRIDMTTGEIEISGQEPDTAAVARTEEMPLMPTVLEHPLPVEDTRPEEGLIAGLDIDALIDSNT